MTQEDKDLLIKDLSPRLPYGVILVCADLVGEELRTITNEGLINNDYDIDEVKPLLFPFSSMTEEQKEEYCSLQQKVIYNSKGLINSDVMEYVNWCYKNHIDINNLIPKGLAKDATGLGIYRKYGKNSTIF